MKKIVNTWNLLDYACIFICISYSTLVAVNAQTLPSQFRDYQTVLATANSQFAIACTSTNAEPILWIQTVNGTGAYRMAFDTRTFTTNNGSNLNFSQVFLSDEEYYACGYMNSSNGFVPFNAYFLYVTAYPALSIVFNGKLVNPNETINMTQSTEYKISCLSVNAKPEVNLLLYDSATLEPLNNATNSLLSQSTCNALKLCTRVLQVNFMLNSQTSKFLTLNSLSCAAESVNSQFYTLASTFRLVNTDQVNVKFKNSQNVIATAGSRLSLTCGHVNASTDRSILWIQTINRTGAFYVAFDNRTFITDNGQNLNFITSLISDEEYYACGYLDSVSNAFVSLQSFFVYVKAYPLLRMVVDGVIIEENQAINLTKAAMTSQVSKISCLAINSKPAVNLMLYDTNTLRSLDNGTNSILSTESCNGKLLCNRVLQVNLDLTSMSTLLTLKSISCVATAVNSLADLRMIITRETDFNANTLTTLPQTTVISTTTSSISTNMTSMSSTTGQPTNTTTGLTDSSTSPSSTLTQTATTSNTSVQSTTIQTILSTTSLTNVSQTTQNGTFTTTTSLTSLPGNTTASSSSSSSTFTTDIVSTTSASISSTQTRTSNSTAESTTPLSTTQGNVTIGTTPIQTGTFTTISSNVTFTTGFTSPNTSVQSTTIQTILSTTSLTNITQTTQNGTFTTTTSLTSLPGNTTASSSSSASTTQGNVTIVTTPIQTGTFTTISSNVTLTTGFSSISTSAASTGVSQSTILTSPLTSIFTTVQTTLTTTAALPPAFVNATGLIADGGSQFALYCNYSTSDTIVWVRSINKTGAFYIVFDNRTFITNNGEYLNFSSILISDEEYYACGSLNAQKAFIPHKAFFLYVRVTPALAILVDGLVINDTVRLNVSDTIVYKITCLSVNSRPDVSLKLFDTKTLSSLDNGANSILSPSRCNEFNLCTRALQISFVLTNSSLFLSMSSLTCQATSDDPNIPLTTSITRRVLNDQIPAEFLNSDRIIANAGSNLSISCDVPSGNPYSWVRTISKTGTYYIQYNNRTFTTNNDSIFNIGFVQISDEDFYACGYVTANKSFIPLRAFFLFVRSYPTLTIAFDGKIIEPSDIINLTVSNAQVYKISCLSVSSKPDVNLALYDTSTSISIAGVPNSAVSQSLCNSNGLCNRVLVVSFTLSTDSPFLYMNSLTCQATSTDTQINLNSSISRSVNTNVQPTTTILPTSFTTITSQNSTLLTSSPSTFSSISSTTLQTTQANTTGFTSTGSISSQTTANVTNTTTLISTTLSTQFSTQNITGSSVTSSTTLSSTGSTAGSSFSSLSSSSISTSNTTEISPSTQATSQTSAFVTTSATTFSQSTQTTLTSSSTTSITTGTTSSLGPLTVISYSFIAAFEGFNYTINCSFDNVAYWATSKDNVTFTPIANSNKYQINPNSLTIFNFNLSDSIYYGCVSDTNLQSTYFVFNKVLPKLNMYVNNVLLNASSLIKFGSLPEIFVRCDSLNSRPNVTVTIVEATTLVPLPLDTSPLNSRSLCSSVTDKCTVIVTARLTPAYAVINNVRSVTCLSANYTKPYDLSVKLTYDVEINTNLCLNNLCKNGSTCIPSRTSRNPFGYRCSCLPELAGPYCNYTNLCRLTPNYCQNGGICSVDNQGAITCTCLGEYSGLTCNFPSSLCTTGNICVNGGLCQPFRNKYGYLCSCLPTFTGQNCTEPYNPCLNGGIYEALLLSSTGYGCNCSSEYQGDLCQYTNPCAKQPCRNGGACLSIEPQIGTYLCICETGFSGANCEISNTQTTRCYDQNPILCQSLPNLTSMCENGIFNGAPVSQQCAKTCMLCN